jgi:hypothetical protein
VRVPLLSPFYSLLPLLLWIDAQSSALCGQTRGPLMLLLAVNGTTVYVVQRRRSAAGRAIVLDTPLPQYEAGTQKQDTTGGLGLCLAFFLLLRAPTKSLAEVVLVHPSTCTFTRLDLA